ncbi:MAG: hypothetical protein VX453_04485 [Acidobacteriota bacterium]|nr:hypothetical protein [Acidobacteriota bacterium]
MNRCLVLLVAVFAVLPRPVLGQAGAGIFLESDALTPLPPDGPEVIRSRVVSVDFDRLDAPRDAVAATHPRGYHPVSSSSRSFVYGLADG